MRRLLAAAILSTLLAVAGYAQTFRGAINGSVTDPSGAVVANAKVTATNVGTGVALNTVTTSNGEYSFQDLPLGTYKVTVSAGGFSQVTVDQVSVTAGSIYTLPVQLKMGQQTTAIEVSAAALSIDTTTTTQTDTITDTALQNIPLNGRDWSQLIAAKTGYGGYSVNGFGSVNGTRANQVNWQIDGTDNNDILHNIPAVNQGGVSGIAGVVMPIDAIDEFSAQTQSQAESGRNAGGVVNLVIKTGTNAFHGSGYYYNRNEFYAAASPFFVPTTDFPKSPRLRNYNTGFTFGGPIIKDKTFFFLGFEKQDYIFGLTGLATEPSQGWVAQAQALLSNTGLKFGPYAPVATSPLSTNLLANLWPSVIRPLPAIANNYFATVPATGYSYNGVVKLDHNFTANEHLSFHYFVGQGSQTQPPGASLALATASSNLGDYFERAPIHVQNYSLILNSVFTPRLTNQVLFGVSYFNQTFSDANNSFDMRALGLDLSPDALINGKPIHGASNIAISGFDQVGITAPEGRNDITGHLTDIVSYTMGRHQIRFGGEVRQGRVDEFYFRRSLGAFNFDGSQGPWAGSPTCISSPQTCALADFLAGDVVSSSVAVGNAERKVRANGLDFFGQDAWQVTRKLNLNLGLRWDYYGPLHSISKDLAVFVPGRGLVIQGNGIDSIFPQDRNNFAPRVGFAYQPRENGQLVIRGGFGVYYDQINMNPFLDFRPPGSGQADGLQDNPIGPSPVDSYSRNVYTWQPGVAVFPGLTTCPTLNVATSPSCGTNHYNVYSVNQNFRTPYFYNFNLQMEHSLGSAAVLQIGYVGSAGHKQAVMLNINQNSGFNAQFPAVGTILQENSIGNSNYHSLQSTLRLRTFRGLTGQFAYTWAHALDDMTQYRGAIPLDSFNLRNEYGNSDFDTRHNFNAYLTYDIPGSSHGPKILTHGWQLSSVLSFHSGQPFNFPGPNPSGTQRPGLDLVADPFAGVDHSFTKSVGGPGGRPGAQWVNPNAFVTVTGPGDVRRNEFYGPGFSDVDLSVIKNIPVTERFRVQLRADMFNVFNRINLFTGAGSVDSHGTIRDTEGDSQGAPGIGPGEPFNMQLAVKIIF